MPVLCRHPFYALTQAAASDALMALVVGLSTIGAMLAWERVRPARLTLVPGALVGVVVGTGLASFGGLTVKRVELPEAILSSLSLPGAGDWARLAEPAMVVMALTLAVIASAESLLSAAAVDRMHDGPRTRYNRELGAQGLGNVLCGLVGGLPMTGVIVRSSANIQAGAATRASTMMHGTWILAFVLALPWLLTLVPTAALAGILVVTGWRLVSPSHMLHLYQRYGLVPAAIWLVTLTTVVVADLLTGVTVGLVMSLIQAIPHLRKGRLRIENSAAQTEVPELHLSGAATFLQLPHLNAALEQQASRRGAIRLAVDRLRHIDHTCLEMIRDWSVRQATAGTHIEVVGGSNRMRQRLARAVSPVPSH